MARRASSGFFDAVMEPGGAWPAFHAGELASCPVRLTRQGAEPWPVDGPNPVRLTYHWTETDGRPVVFDGLRTPLPPDMAADDPAVIELRVQAPPAPGDYRLQVTLVQEGVAWFETRGLAPLERPVSVEPSFYAADLELVAPPEACHAGERFRVVARITRRTPCTWPAGGAHPVRVTYHWLDDRGQMAVFDGLRTPLPAELAEGRSLDVALAVLAPPAPGRYVLQVTLVRESVAWFEQRGFVPASCPVQVVAAADAATSAGPAVEVWPDRVVMARERPRPFHDWDGYWRWSLLHRELHQPYRDEDLRIVGYLEGNAARLARDYARRPQDRLISIIMPVFNRAAMVGDAIASVLAQTYTPWELLVVDDASGDDTVEVVRALADPRIRLIARAVNGGPSAARNTGLAEARGDIVAYLDSDNAWRPDYLLVMRHALEDAPWARSIYCAQRVTWNIGGQPHESIRFGPFHRALLENENYLDINAFAHWRTLADEVGGFDERLRWIEDWEFILRCTGDVAPLALPALLSEYRARDDGGGAVQRMDLIDDTLRQRAFRLPLAGGGTAPPPARGYAFFVSGAPRRASEPRFVSIVIPSFEAAEYLAACLDAVYAFTPPDGFEVIVVDNASSPAVDAVLDRYRERPGFTRIDNGRNLGFTHAANQGIAAARAGADVVLLNNDALVTPGWLEALQEAAASAPDIGIVAPRQVLLPGTATRQAHVPGGNPDREIDVTLSAHHDNVVDPAADPPRGLVELSFAPFFCVYLTRGCLDRVGPLDAERGPHYHSDHLYCDLARHGAGLRVIYTPHAKVYHFLQRATADLEACHPEDYRRLFGYGPAATGEAGPTGALADRPAPGPPRLAAATGLSYQRLTGLSPLAGDDAALVRRFTALYCDLWNQGRPGGRGTIAVGWLGHLAQKCPLDLWIYQEILTETMPDLIIECGTRLGGSALFLASVCQLLGRGRVVTVDIRAEPERPVHRRITYVEGSSVAPAVVERVRGEALAAGRVMVILDSDHSRDHVLAELYAYADLVTPGCYLVVEDTVVNGHPFWPDFGPGPMEAVDAFLSGRPDYEIDTTRERFLLTLNPRGYLRRLPNGEGMIAGRTIDAARRERLDTLKRRLLDLDGVSVDDGTRFVNHLEEPLSLAERRQARLEGRDWPARALTMTGLKRLDQFQAAIETVVAEGVAGDIIETGVWRGGACILARAVLAELGVTDRRVWLADSFAGLPPPQPERYPADAGDRHHEHDYLCVSLDAVRANIAAFGLLDEQVRFLPGWFAETLPTSPVERIAVLRLDGDMYASTRVALDSLYPRLSPGAVVIVDDYGAVPACRLAVDEFRCEHGLTAPLEIIDWTGRYWRVPVRFTDDERTRLRGAAPAAESGRLDLWAGHVDAESDRRCEAARVAFESGDPAGARRVIDEVVAAEPNSLPAHVLLARLALGGPDYHQVLADIHRRVRPRTYVELGVFKGESLALAAAASRVVAVDPRPLIDGPTPASTRLFRMTSAGFFADGDAERWLAGEGFDLAFIDASHRFADALLDFMCLERFAHRGSVVLLHDTWPVDPRVASPARTTTFYTGDVWKVVAALRALRSDLDVRTVPCMPSGLTIIRGLDAASRVLWDRFDDCLARFAPLDYAWLDARRDEVLAPHDGPVDLLLGPASPSVE